MKKNLVIMLLLAMFIMVGCGSSIGSKDSTVTITGKPLSVSAFWSESHHELCIMIEVGEKLVLAKLGSECTSLISDAEALILTAIKYEKDISLIGKYTSDKTFKFETLQALGHTVEF